MIALCPCCQDETSGPARACLDCRLRFYDGALREPHVHHLIQLSTKIQYIQGPPPEAMTELWHEGFVYRLQDKAYMCSAQGQVYLGVSPIDARDKWNQYVAVQLDAWENAEAKAMSRAAEAFVYWGLTQLADRIVGRTKNFLPDRVMLTRVEELIRPHMKAHNLRGLLRDLRIPPAGLHATSWHSAFFMSSTDSLDGFLNWAAYE